LIAESNLGGNSNENLRAYDVLWGRHPPPKAVKALMLANPDSSQNPDDEIGGRFLSAPANLYPAVRKQSYY
jgi:hypothetical protein